MFKSSDIIFGIIAVIYCFAFYFAISAMMKIADDAEEIYQHNLQNFCPIYLSERPLVNHKFWLEKCHDLGRQSHFYIYFSYKDGTYGF